MRRAAFYLTCGSLGTILFSIALSQLLMGVALVALVISNEEIRFPPVRLPLALFFLATVIAAIVSGHPLEGMPQIRKFYVFAILLVVYSTFRTLAQIRAMVLVWAGIGLLSAVSSLVQFFHRYQQAQLQHAQNYDFYLWARTTGFASHWMTFGGEEMIVTLMLAALLFFSRERTGKWFGWICLPVLWIALVLGLTRSVFLLGLPLGGVYLLWNWKRWLLVGGLVAVGIAAVTIPLPVRERVLSVVRPHGEIDSNMHRTITRRTGWEMVKAHPWFGLGPEQIKPHFNEYVPGDIPRPLPPGWYGHLHNIYLQYAAERGIPGLLMISWLIGRFLFDSVRWLGRSRAGSEARFVWYGAVSVILAVLAEGFFEYNLGDSEVLTLFLAVMGWAYSARGVEATAPGADELTEAVACAVAADSPGAI